MKRVKMPFYMRMQNFLYLPGGEIFWTSASLSIPQKLNRWWNNDKSEICNTSKGYTLPWHGQMLRYDGKYLIHDWWVNANYYDIDTGKHVRTEKTKLHDLMGIKALCPDKSLQGLSFKGGKFDYASFGNADKGSIKVFNIETGVIFKQLEYDDFKEDYWKYYEAEGLNYNLKGELEIGISVKTKFFSRYLGAILNYTHKV